MAAGSLDHETLDRLAVLAVENELYRAACRAQLLAHLPERFVELIAVEDDPIDQLRVDLDHLNRHPRLPDHHQPPLATWLQNAYLLTTPGDAAREFRRIRHRLVGPARQQEILRSLTRIKKITVADASRLSAERDRVAPTLAGDILGGRFALEKRLGEGAVAEVWRARDLAAGTLAAVKVLKARWAENPERRARFFSGARQMAGFGHPHILPVIMPEGEDAGRFYCVLEYLDAGDLEAALRDGRIRQSTGLRALLQVSSGAAAMHAAGVVHLDIKPQNILLGSDGRVMLGDFDRVRLTAADGGGQTETIDSIFYLAPETFDERRRPGPAADVFSLGMTALFVLHGERLPAWIVRRPAALLRRIECPDAVRQVIARAIAVDPADRYGDVEGFAVELEGALGRPSGALPVIEKLISQAPRSVPPPAASPGRASGPMPRVEGAPRSEGAPARERSLPIRSLTAPPGPTSGGFASGGFAAGGPASGGFASGGFTTGAPASGGIKSGGFASGGIKSGGLGSAPYPARTTAPPVVAPAVRRTLPPPSIPPPSLPPPSPPPSLPPPSLPPPSMRPPSMPPPSLPPPTRSPRMSARPPARAGELELDDSVDSATQALAREAAAAALAEEWEAEAGDAGESDAGLDARDPEASDPEASDPEASDPEASDPEASDPGEDESGSDGGGAAGSVSLPPGRALAESALLPPPAHRARPSSPAAVRFDPDDEGDSSDPDADEANIDALDRVAEFFTGPLGGSSNASLGRGSKPEAPPRRVVATDAEPLRLRPSAAIPEPLPPRAPVAEPPRAPVAEPPRPPVSEPRPLVSEPRPPVSEPRPPVSEPRPPVAEPRPPVAVAEPLATEPPRPTTTQPISVPAARIATPAPRDALEERADVGAFGFSLEAALDDVARSRPVESPAPRSEPQPPPVAEPRVPFEPASPDLPSPERRGALWMVASLGLGLIGWGLSNRWERAPSRGDGWRSVGPEGRPDAGRDVPDVGAAGAPMPDARLPDARLPDAQMPDAQMPDAQVPDAQLLNAQVPDAAPTPAPDAAPTPAPDAARPAPRRRRRPPRNRRRTTPPAPTRAPPVPPRPEGPIIEIPDEFK